MRAEFRHLTPFFAAFLIAYTIEAGTPVRADEAVAGGDAAFYIDLGAGGILLDDADLEGAGIDTEAAFDAGPAGRAAFGRRYENGLRAEIEIAARSSDIDSIGGSSGSGDVLGVSGMVNGYYDVAMGGGFTPYLGLGLGAMRVDADGVSPVSSTSVSDDDIAFAYQGIVGGAWALGGGMALTADYRYLATTDLDLSTASGVGLDPTYRSHTVFVGLRIDVGGVFPKVAGQGSEQKTDQGSGQGSGEGAEAEQAALGGESGGEDASESAGGNTGGDMGGGDAGGGASATAADTRQAAIGALPDFARAYRVLFDLDSAALTPAASAVLEELAENAKAGEIIRIKAVGHADASGARSYNMGLSKSRAVQVKAALARLGVPAERIVIYWKGESELLVPTDDGIPEPQNRRVEIAFPE